MDRSPSISYDRPADRRVRVRSWFGGIGGAAGGARSENLVARGRRVAMLVGLIWLIGIHDLVLTLAATHLEGFRQLNPITRSLLGDPSALVAFKLLMMAPATLIFLLFRRRVLTEVGCWLLSAAYVSLGLLWITFDRHGR